jgi:hypothetical protein
VINQLGILAATLKESLNKSSVTSSNIEKQ